MKKTRFLSTIACLSALALPYGAVTAGIVQNSATVCQNFYAGQQDAIDYVEYGVRNVDLINDHFVVCPLGVAHSNKAMGSVTVRYRSAKPINCYFYTHEAGDKELGMVAVPLKPSATGVKVAASIPQTLRSTHVALCALPAKAAGVVMSFENNF
ncbi:MAG: hypothetical protein HOP36_09435 [Methyloglobulus sp.]|nr:hypothetical protein [Methyloglobulus sp.]